jgi:type II secretory pathway component PulF
MKKGHRLLKTCGLLTHSNVLQKMTSSAETTETELRRPGRITRIILFAAAMLGSVVFVVIFFAIPVFNAMFADFGAELPSATKFFIAARLAYPTLAVVFGVGAYHLLYGRFQRKGSVFWILGLLGFEYAVFVLSVAAMFMPILQLSAVSPK